MNKQGLTAFFLFSAFFFIYSNIIYFYYSGQFLRSSASQGAQPSLPAGCEAIIFM